MRRLNKTLQLVQLFQTSDVSQETPAPTIFIPEDDDDDENDALGDFIVLLITGLILVIVFGSLVAAFMYGPALMRRYCSCLTSRHQTREERLAQRRRELLERRMQERMEGARNGNDIVLYPDLDDEQVGEEANEYEGNQIVAAVYVDEKTSIPDDAVVVASTFHNDDHEPGTVVELDPPLDSN